MAASGGALNGSEQKLKMAASNLGQERARDKWNTTLSGVENGREQQWGALRRRELGQETSARNYLDSRLITPEEECSVVGKSDGHVGRAVIARSRARLDIRRR
ncbi:Uncharacterized protein Fot_11955 [Forsythia ovata]|uniref:Uncharacterized protein n=1 Tax=Forsythia ovata TaxID=205694 RepID=A0ABD1WL56_9LAMI